MSYFLNFFNQTFSWNRKNNIFVHFSILFVTKFVFPLFPQGEFKVVEKEFNMDDVIQASQENRVKKFTLDTT